MRRCCQLESRWWCDLSWLLLLLLLTLTSQKQLAVLSHVSLLRSVRSTWWQLIIHHSHESHCRSSISASCPLSICQTQTRALMVV